MEKWNKDRSKTLKPKLTGKEEERGKRKGTKEIKKKKKERMKGNKEEKKKEKMKEIKKNGRGET